MKRTLSLIAIATVATMAAPVKFGADALVGYDILSIGSDIEGMESSTSFGVAVGPTAAYSINDKLAIGGGVSFLWDMLAMKAKEGDGEMSMKLMSLGFQIAPSYKINDKISAKLGYEWDMPLGGTSTTEFGDESEDMDITWAPEDAKDFINDDGEQTKDPVVSTHNIVLGGAYALNENLAVALQAKFALNGMMPKYNDEGKFDGAEESSKNVAVQQIALGVSYSFN